MKNTIRLIKSIAFALCLYFICGCAKADTCPPPSTFGQPLTFVTEIYGYMVNFTWKDSKDAFCLAHREQKGQRLYKNLFQESKLLQIGKKC